MVESEWQHLNVEEHYWGRAASKVDFMTLLAGLETIYIKATYHTAQVYSRCVSVRFIMSLH